MKTLTFIFAVLLALPSGAALAAEDNSGFGASLFTNEAPAALGLGDDPVTALDADAAAKMEPAAGDESNKELETVADQPENSRSDQDSGATERGSSSQ